MVTNSNVKELLFLFIIFYVRRIKPFASVFGLLKEKIALRLCRRDLGMLV